MILFGLLRTAVENGEVSLDSDATSYNDLLNGFPISVQFCSTVLPLVVDFHF